MGPCRGVRRWAPVARGRGHGGVGKKVTSTPAAAALVGERPLRGVNARGITERRARAGGFPTSERGRLATGTKATLDQP